MSYFLPSNLKPGSLCRLEGPCLLGFMFYQVPSKSGGARGGQLGKTPRLALTFCTLFHECTW